MELAYVQATRAGWYEVLDLHAENTEVAETTFQKVRGIFSHSLTEKATRIVGKTVLSSVNQKASALHFCPSSSFKESLNKDQKQYLSYLVLKSRGMSRFERSPVFS